MELYGRKGGASMAFSPDVWIISYSFTRAGDSSLQSFIPRVCVSSIVNTFTVSFLFLQVMSLGGKKNIWTRKTHLVIPFPLDRMGQISVILLPFSARRGWGVKWQFISTCCAHYCLRLGPRPETKALEVNERNIVHCKKPNPFSSWQIWNHRICWKRSLSPTLTQPCQADK